MFILHKASLIRQYLLMLVTTQEDIVEEQKAESNPEKYGIEDITKSQNFSELKINEGKILLKK